MKNLTDVYNQVASHDAELEKQAAQMIKQAEEEDAAGRIMARGFADELNKIAQPQGTFDTLKKPGFGQGGFGGTVQSKPGYDLGGAGKSGQGYGGGMQRRPGAAERAGTMAGGGSKGGLVGAPPAGGVGKKPPAPAPGGGAPRGPVVAGGALPRPNKMP